MLMPIVRPDHRDANKGLFNMTLLTGPLHSLRASGQLARTIIYEESMGRSYAKSYNVPRNDRTPKEIGIRAMVYFLTKLWKNLTTPQRATWFLLSLHDNITPFNAYFKYNMQRWAADLPPLVELADVPAAAYTPTLAIVATPSAGQVSLAITPATIAQHVDVTAGGTPPSPDATGRYPYYEERNGLHAYRRTVPSAYRIAWDTTGDCWVLYPKDSYTFSGQKFLGGATLAGTYNNAGGASGDAVVSADVPEGPDTAAAAITIFRSASTITTPLRTICRAVAIPDGSGNWTFVDTGQVGGKAGPPGGLPSGTYHYMANPLSLDGRAGTPTADTPATVP